MTKKMQVLVLAAVALAGLNGSAYADDVAATAKKLVIIDKSNINGTAKLVFLSKDPALHVGPAGGAQSLSAMLQIVYVDEETNSALYSLPDSGWERNDGTLAKYRNSSAPVGGGVKVAIVKPGTVGRIIGASLGDGPLLNVTNAPGAGGIMVILTFTSNVDASVHRMCTLFPNGNGEIDHKAIAGGLGRRLLAKNGVAAGCPESAAETVPDDTTVDTDTEADGASAADPLESAVTTPNGGSVQIVEGPPAGTPPDGFAFVGQQADITAPLAAPDDPLILGFSLDLSVLPVGAHHSSVEVFRDGVLVKPCIGAPGLPEPDPCVVEREVVGDDLDLTILSAHASRWTFGLPPCACLPGGTGECTGGQICKSNCQCAPACDCCANTPGTYEFTSAVGSGDCGTATNPNGSLAANLACNRLYLGGGSNSLPLPATLADQVKLTMNVASCDAATERLQLAATSAAQTGSNRNCTAAGCRFGGPLPIPNSGSTPVSTCLVPTVSQAATGTASCDGSAQIVLPLTGEVFLTGDLSVAPGIQACPICSSGTCDGGPNHGLGCTPSSSDLGDPFPTSHDCPPSPGLIIGTVALGTTFTTGVARAVAAPSGGQQRVFCGFCRDVDDTGGFGVCIGGGTPGAACNSTGNCGAGFCGGARSCVTDTDCAGDVRESCQQRNNGAFGPNGGAVQTINLTGSPAGCLADGFSHASTLVAAGCIEPTLEATIDAVGDFPGPTAFSYQGSALLGGPVPTTTSSTSSTTTSTTSTTLGGCCNSNSFYSFGGSGVGGDCGDLRDATGALVTNISCNGRYLGGGGTSFVLPHLWPDGPPTVFAITACTGQSATLGAATAAATGSIGNCSDTGCLFGAPLPIPNTASTPTSHCIVHSLAAPAAGLLNCGTGAEQLSLAIASEYFLTGDTATDPSGTIPGIQPCPLCVAGTCVGGANNGMSGCTPTSDFGNAFPTSQDCPPEASLNLGTLPVAFTMATGTVTWSGTVATNDTGSTASTQTRVFSGFCRDKDATLNFKQPAQLCWENGMAVGAACSGTFESCEQRSNGAFGPNGGANRTITVIGTAQGSLLSGPASGALATIFTAPPFFDATVDAALDLPGPAALVLDGTGQLCATASPCP